jgi:hypothetical protein
MENASATHAPTLHETRWGNFKTPPLGCDAAFIGAAQPLWGGGDATQIKELLFVPRQRICEMVHKLARPRAISKRGLLSTRRLAVQRLA